MDYYCYNCKSLLGKVQDELFHCPKCELMMTKELLENIKYHQSRDNIDPNETVSKGTLTQFQRSSNASLDHKTLKSFDKEFKTQPCPSCNNKITLKKIDNLLMFCYKCDQLFGYDDTTNFYDLANFFPDISQEEILEELESGKATFEINCHKCNNSDPNFVLIYDGSDGKDPGLYCAKCNCKMDSISDEINDLPDQCECDRDPSIIKFLYNEEGNISFAECSKCGRCIDVQKRDETKWSDKGAYNGRVKVDTLDLIEPGSHIAWHQQLSYWHHAIVTKVYKKENKIEVINYTGPNLPNKGEILKEVISVDFNKKTQMYRLDYNQARYSNEEAIARAHLRLGESSYNIFTNNCESFAHWCKTGVNYSQQFIDFFDSIRSQVTIGAAKNLVQSAGKFIAKGLTKSFLSKYAHKAIPIVGLGTAVVATGYHIFNTCNDIKKANQDRREGKIDRNEFVKIILKRVSRTVAVGTVILALSTTGLCGTILGSLFSMVAELAAEGGGCLVGRALTTVEKLN